MSRGVCVRGGNRGAAGIPSVGEAGAWAVHRNAATCCIAIRRDAGDGGRTRPRAAIGASGASLAASPGLPSEDRRGERSRATRADLEFDYWAADSVAIRRSQMAIAFR